MSADVPPLFQTGDFTLASGAKSRWKIECDALTTDDWAGLAAIAAEILPSFSEVVGVPRGGLPFANALRRYATKGPLLVADDVWTTGGSMKTYAARFHPGRYWFGVVAFARNRPDYWVRALFTMDRGSQSLMPVGTNSSEALR